MSTLLLRLASPLQSWGVGSKFDTRDTAREPTKSGVIGLLAAALGRSREANLDDLKALNFAVRIDQPGSLLRDFHTARQVKGSTSYVTTRYYLADAIFLAGLEGEEEFLRKLEIALLNPVFPLFLGRRSCPPSGRLVLGLRNQKLEDALRAEPWLASDWFRKRSKKSKIQADHVKLTIVSDAKADDPGVFLRQDLPVSFDQQYRKYDFRTVTDTVDALSVQISQYNSELTTEHDALSGLED